MVSKLLALAGGMRGFLVLIGAGLVGVTVGIMGFTFGYANGFAYFADDPATCKQCHSMNKQYDAWAKGSHKTVACQECHSPEKHSQPVQWLLSEADNGFWHSLKFTTGAYPTNIKIRDHNKELVRENCLNCHGNLVSQIEQPSLHSNAQIDCLRCHNEVGHKR
ncbi:cytochrome c nitrite reductase small subunit [Propioniciclava tarda]|nr:cytochrome c nitrite reductase small subunit [Propioniciclava tarda]SMO42189.1 respiratory nitrite reductase specific menaquinol--cytochrome-c reductase (NrfH) precursor [Propioniciclava tarda]HOA87909.1 cytochrome c nitrite reductase small subunit [Propioniciclava tarda]HQA30079.1 cytochrome c nitrite reductase small subunit [Propioniciclava tarda]HQD59811.1 cytochrome c nitrite reductase small subunit [Propioniciclava tarda]